MNSSGSIQTISERTAVFGGLILGVWAGTLIGDAIAVTVIIHPGYVRSVESVPTLLAFRLTGACIGLCSACIFEVFARKSPKAIHWLAWFLLSVAYWLVIRIPFEMMARE